MRLKLLSCAAAAVALLLCALPALADPILLVYRADTRSPDTVFATGFSGRGANMDVLAHTLGGSCDETSNLLRASQWVSTSAMSEEAIGFANLLLVDRAYGEAQRVWVYTIRPDLNYFVVPSLLTQVAEAGDAGLHGYTPQHADIIDQLLRTTLLAVEAEVLTHHVEAANIINARPVWLDDDGQLQVGAAQPNPRYLDLDTTAVTNVQNLNAFVPPASIRLDLLDDNGASSGSESDQCSMTCDRATSASSFSAVQAATVSKACNAPKRASPAVLDIILGY
jgi:hypothetical protein